ncbi:MAG TPA: phosphotransferase [Fimbriimonas sp.]|nr:phosphotransferase [Fimbriimonas sp.]
MKPAHFTGAYSDYTTEDIEWVALQFQVNGPVLVAPFPGRGNINLHTYHVIAGGEEYLLQKVNSDVFTMPYRVMKSMVASIRAQNESLEAGLGDELWEPIELVPTRDDQPFLDLTDEHGWSVWRLMVRISKSVCYKSLSEVSGRNAQLALATQVGKGLAIYSDLTACIDPNTIEGSLPGYRDTGLYYRQFHSVMAANRTFEQAASLLPTDPILFDSTGQHFLVGLDDQALQDRRNDPELAPFIALVVEQEPFAMVLWNALQEGTIRHTLIHGDTKIENFLFCSHSGRVKGLVDLDTIMPFTWLADWGDMVRSMVNVAGEKERDLSKVTVDRDVYDAVARGFLEAAREVTDAEVSLMVASVQAITLELGLRFLTDYLRGDTYFQLSPNDPPDLNRVRAMVQLTLYRRLVEFGPAAEERIAAYRRSPSLS